VIKGKVGRASLDPKKECGGVGGSATNTLLGAQYKKNHGPLPCWRKTFTQGTRSRRRTSSRGISFTEGRRHRASSREKKKGGPGASETGGQGAKWGKKKKLGDVDQRVRLTAKVGLKKRRVDGGKKKPSADRDKNHKKAKKHFQKDPKKTVFPQPQLQPTPPFFFFPAR